MLMTGVRAQPVQVVVREEYILIDEHSLIATCTCICTNIRGLMAMII